MGVQYPVPPMPRGAEEYGAWWDERAAQAACGFFSRYLRHTEAEWAGKPFNLLDWQAERIIRPAFGWKRADGSRLIRIIWIEVPRKNGKTELAAGVSLLCLLGDGEMGGQVYSMAVDKDQAKIVFNKAGVMVGYSEDLRQKLEVFKTSIFCQQLLASFKPLSSGPGGKHGFSPTAAIGDEVHEWTDGGELADVVHKGTAARRQPLEVYITTAGVSGQGYAWEMHELALQIIKGEVIDPTFLPVIFAASEDMDWKSEDAWRAANPNYGISVKPDYMRKEAEKAARSPRAENDFKRFHLNLWTEQVTRWLSMESWNKCTAQPDEKDHWQRLFELMKGRKCFAGLDLAITNDLSAWCLAFEPDEKWPNWVFTWRFWLPKMTVEEQPIARRKRYEAFAASGALALTEGNVTDYGFIQAQILRDAKDYRIQKIGIDKFNASQLAVDLLNTHGLPVEWFRQGYLSMNAPAKEFERKIIAEQIEHGSHPVAKWNAGNAVVTTDPAGNIKPDKAKAANKIDGIVAAIMALGLSLGDETQTSVYENRGIRRI